MSTAIIGAASAVIVALIGEAVKIIINRLDRKDKKEDDSNAVQQALDEVRESINDLKDAVDRVSYKNDETATVQCRVRILRFSDELSNGVRHSKDHFEQTLEDIRQYDRFCGEHPEFRNDITTASISLIRENFAERLRRNDFL